MTNEPERVSVRLPKEMADELRARAHVQNSTLTTVIVDLLRTASESSFTSNYLGSTQTLAGGGLPLSSETVMAPSCQHPRVRQIQGGAWYCPGCNRRFPTKPKT